MVYHALSRWFISGVVLLALCCMALPVIAADQTQEIAARALLGEAEKLLELSHAQDALPILDKVQSEYPGTEAAAYAEFRRAEALSHFDIDAALVYAQRVVAQNPGTLLACWAQCVVGETLIAKKQLVQGIGELLKVADMLPDQTDLGPLERAENALACHVSSELDGLSMLGKAATDRKMGARLLSMLVSSAARTGAIDKAEALLNRIESVYPTELVDVERAQAIVEAGKVRKNMMEEPLAQVADTSLLKTKLALMEGYSAVENAILLAKNCVRRGRITEAVSILEQVEERGIITQKAPELLYEMGKLLNRTGKSAEAASLLEQIVSNYPTSGYVAPALYLIGGNVNQPTAITALTTLAKGGYPKDWRARAYWRLGRLYASQDKAKAVECYNGAICLFQECIAENKADVSEDWKERLLGNIEMIEQASNSLTREVAR